jgi:hypothetical protein
MNIYIYIQFKYSDYWALIIKNMVNGQNFKFMSEKFNFVWTNGDH